MAEFHTFKNLVTYWSEKNWLSRDCRYVGPYMTTLITKREALFQWLHLWFWASTLWWIDSCHNKLSTGQYHVTISWAQVDSSSRLGVFLKLTADLTLVYRLDRGLKSRYFSGGDGKVLPKAKFREGVVLFRLPCRLFFLLFFFSFYRKKRGEGAGPHRPSPQNPPLQEMKFSLKRVASLCLRVLWCILVLLRHIIWCEVEHKG